MRLRVMCLAASGTVCLALAVGVSPGDTPGVDDAWLAKITLSELEKSAETGKYDELAKRVKDAVLGRLSLGNVEDLTALADMIYVHRACKYSKLAPETKDGAALYKWVLSKRPVARLLFRALGDINRPAGALDALSELKTANEKAVLAYPELAVAFATSRSSRGWFRDKQLKPASMVEAFKYYTTNRFRYDLKKMPYELSRFLADTTLSIPERRWALGKYRNYSNPAKTYFDIKYDVTHYRKGAPKKISRVPFTLPNLRKVGGVCIEQAYYASEVCKALGMPATVVTGRGAGGASHAWVACLRITPGGKRVAWDSRTGRYKAHRYHVGQLWNPATGEALPDSELALLGRAVLLPLRQREAADAAIALAKIACDLSHEDKVADMTALQAFAKLCAERIKDAKAPDPASLAAKVKINMSVVEDLVSTALARNLAQSSAWNLLIDLRSRDLLEVSHLDRFFDVLISKTAKAFPDYSCEMVLKIVPTIPDAKKRLSVYKKAVSVYARRPDLTGRITIATGDDYLNQNDRQTALKVYQSTAIKYVDLAMVVVPAARKAETLLTGAGKTKTAILLYSSLFKRARKPGKTAFFRQTTYYQLGARLAELLESAGRTSSAKKIRKAIGDKAVDVDDDDDDRRRRSRG